MPRGGKSNGGPRTHAVKNPGYTGAIDAMYDPVAYINCTTKVMELYQDQV